MQRDNNKVSRGACRRDHRQELSRNNRSHARKRFSIALSAPTSAKIVARRGERGTEAINTSARRPEGDDYSAPMRTIARNSPVASGMTDKRDWRKS